MAEPLSSRRVEVLRFLRAGVLAAVLFGIPFDLFGTCGPEWADPSNATPPLAVRKVVAGAVAHGFAYLAATALGLGLAVRIVYVRRRESPPSSSMRSDMPAERQTSSTRS